MKSSDEILVVIGSILLAIVLLFLAGNAFATSEEETLIGSIDALAAVLGAIGASLATLVGKHQYDKRKDGGSSDVGAQALDSIKAHEIACAEERETNREEHQLLHDRVSGVKDEVVQLRIDVAEMKGDIKVIKTLSEERCK